MAAEVVVLLAAEVVVFIGKFPIAAVAALTTDVRGAVAVFAHAPTTDGNVVRVRDLARVLVDGVRELIIFFRKKIT